MSRHIPPPWCRGRGDPAGQLRQDLFSWAASMRRGARTNQSTGEGRALLAGPSRGVCFWGGSLQLNVVPGGTKTKFLVRLGHRTAAGLQDCKPRQCSERDPGACKPRQSVPVIVLALRKSLQLPCAAAGWFWCLVPLYSQHRGDTCFFFSPRKAPGNHPTAPSVSIHVPRCLGCFRPWKG